MAIKLNNPQPSQQDQADRPPIFGPLVAGVVVIKAFAAIKGEQAVGAPAFDWIAEDRDLSLGDDVMLLLVAGDIRDRVIPVLTDTLNAIKSTVTAKTEFAI